MNWNSVPDKKEVKLKAQPPYWRLENMLKSLRLKYKKVDQDSASFHLTVPDFGMAFRLNPAIPMLAYTDWDVLDVDLDSLELNASKFYNQLILLLISKGYMAFLRNKESGDSQRYRYLLVNEGWGVKIIDWRLAAYENKPKHKFMIEHNKRLRLKSIHYILNHYPDFFDYLW